MAGVCPPRVCDVSIPPRSVKPGFTSLTAPPRLRTSRVLVYERRTRRQSSVRAPNRRTPDPAPHGRHDAHTGRAVEVRPRHARPDHHVIRPHVPPNAAPVPARASRYRPGFFFPRSRAAARPQAEVGARHSPPEIVDAPARRRRFVAHLALLCQPRPGRTRPHPRIRTPRRSGSGVRGPVTTSEHG